MGGGRSRTPKTLLLHRTESGFCRPKKRRVETIPKSVSYDSKSPFYRPPPATSYVGRPSVGHSEVPSPPFAVPTSTDRPHPSRSHKGPNPRLKVSFVDVVGVYVHPPPHQGSLRIDTYVQTSGNLFSSNLRRLAVVSGGTPGLVDSAPPTQDRGCSCRAVPGRLPYTLRRGTHGSPPNRVAPGFVGEGTGGPGTRTER